MVRKGSSSIYRRIVKFIWITFLIIIIAIPVYFFSVKVNLFNLYGGLPGLRELENPDPDLASLVYSADHELLGKYFSYNRNPVDFHDLSPNLVDALVATEDRRYYSHSGIDLKGLVRAFVNYFVLRRNREGGSTITQQLAKMLWETRSDKYEGRLSRIGFLQPLIVKTKEWLVAIQIERSYTKQEIIAMYFNTMPFGNNTFGIRVASRTYFGKLPARLEIHEAALLVGVVNGPSVFNPLRNPERAIRRRNWVIWQMYNNGYISKETHDTAIEKDLELKYTPENYDDGMAPYFRAVLKENLKIWASKNNFDLDRDGLKIYTTIDSRIQRHAESALKEHMRRLQQLFNREWSSQHPWERWGDKNYIEQAWRNSGRFQSLTARYGANSDSISLIANQPRMMKVFTWQGEKDTILSPVDSIIHYKRLLQAGFMAMDPHNGHIKAWVGGIDFKYFKYDHVSQGRNQPGSIFKPIVYATAIENGYSPCFKVTDAPVAYPNPGGNPPYWMPNNATAAYNGKTMTLREALGRSVNRITAFMMNKVGIQNVVEMAGRLGVESPLNPVMSLSLGTSDVTLREMLGVYSAFVNDGTWIEPHGILRIEDKFGNTVYQKTAKSREALSDETAYLMLHMLRGTVEEDGGTASSLSDFLKKDNQIGGKTGTTSDYADGWFIGITEDLVAGAWVGGDDRAIRFPSIRYGQGAVMAMPIWERFMTAIYKDEKLQIEKKSFKKPKRPVLANLDCD